VVVTLYFTTEVNLLFVVYQQFQVNVSETL